MPPTINNIRQILDKYSATYPGESIEPVRQFVNNTSVSDQLYDRKNFNGHITASALIVDSEHRLLVILHAVFNRYLQPGGHVEKGDSTLLEGALREAREETNLHPHDLVNIPVLVGEPDMPFHIDSHEIPLNDKKIEPVHVHHDFCYVFRYKGSGAVIADLNETKGFRWISINEMNKIGLSPEKLTNYLLGNISS